MKKNCLIFDWKGTTVVQSRIDSKAIVFLSLLVLLQLFLTNFYIVQ